ncbi:MAG: hypothetical protein AAGI89_05755 [Pseudomonadota bacterium]
MSTRTQTIIIAVLWFAWSVPHIVPGLLMIQSALAGDLSSIKFLFPETDPQTLMRDHPREVAAISVTFGQHGFNLFWFGVVALIGAGLIGFRQSRVALIATALVVGCADLGALFATFMIGRIDVIGILIFAGTLLGVLLTVSVLRKGVGGEQGSHASTA